MEILVESHFERALDYEGIPRQKPPTRPIARRIGIAEVERRLDEDIQPELRDLVQELVRAEDGVRLILHELSVGLLRGRERPPGPLEVPGVKIRAGGDNVMYRFEGEFWTDEIDDLVVTIPDRCLEQRITISQ